MPLDVVTQRIMVQPAGESRYQGWRGLQVVWRDEGVRGLYRGFGLSVLSYVPASAIWWSTYTAVHSRARDALPDARFSWLVTGVCGAVAGFTSAALTNPLDVIKTRLQVLQGWDARRDGSRVAAVVRSLVAEEGVRGFSKGLTARLASSSVVSLFIITTYEGVKRLSRQPRQAHAAAAAATVAATPAHAASAPSASMSEQLAT